MISPDIVLREARFNKELKELIIEYAKKYSVPLDAAAKSHEVQTHYMLHSGI